MFKSHFYRISRSKTNLIAFFLLLIIPMFEIVQLLIYQNNSSEVFHPAFAFFLSGSSIGHAPQIIMLWFLPIYLLLLGADDSIQDYKTGYRNILISKVGRKNYYIEKLVTSFVFSFGTVFLSLAINFVLVLLLFAGGTFSKGLLDMVEPSNLLFSLSISNPYLAILFFSILMSLIAGLAGLLGASTSLFFLDKKFAYASAFFIWFLLVLNENSLTYLFQPFTELNLEMLLYILALSVVILLIFPIITFFYGVKISVD